MNRENTPSEFNWQNYRSTINDDLAIFSANLSLKAQYPVDGNSFIVQFAIPYDGDEQGLPLVEQYSALMAEILKSITQLSALPDTYYAGHILCKGKAQIYFYTANVADFGETLKQFGYEMSLNVQEDNQWELYFDFLLPSSLEKHINDTEDLLDQLIQQGHDLSQKFEIEHNFHFANKENMFAFIEKLSLSSFPFSGIKYTDERIPVDEDREAYLIKLVQELSLDNADIFNFIEQFDQLIYQYDGQYVGWGCSELLSGNVLN